MKKSRESEMPNFMTGNSILSIAVISWNTCELTKNCLDSIFENTKGINYELIVVDNGSSDNSVEVIEKTFQQVRLIKNSRNLGFAEANNQALEISKGKYFLLLNSDTIVHGDALKRMVDFLDTHVQVGAVTCKLLNSDGTPQSNMYQRFPTIFGLVYGFLQHIHPYFKAKWERERFMPFNRMDVTGKIEQAPATCIMIRKDILSCIGGLFDAKRFPIFYNDVDLCYRLYKKHFDLYLVSDAVITHLAGQSVKKLDVFSWKKEHAVSSLNFYKKHRRYPDYLLSKIAYLVRYSFIVLYYLLLLLIRKASLTSFKGWLSLLLSVLLDREVNL
jgi:GT2 family glycosyltransferase